MWIADDVSLAVQRNASIPLGFQMLDAIDNSPVDLTGFSVTMAIAKGPGLAVITTIAGVVDVPEHGSFYVIVDGSAFSGVDGAQEIVALAYDIRLTAPDATKLIAVRGAFYLEPGVNV